MHNFPQSRPSLQPLIVLVYLHVSSFNEECRMVMATNQENWEHLHLEYSEISLNMESSENPAQHSGKIVMNKILFVCHSNTCVKILFWT